jgi:hypothetical protein
MSDKGSKVNEIEKDDGITTDEDNDKNYGVVVIPQQGSSTHTEVPMLSKLFTPGHIAVGSDKREWMELPVDRLSLHQQLV